jgi:DNA-binding CsgD family transcriptional regulator
VDRYFKSQQRFVGCVQYPHRITVEQLELVDAGDERGECLLQVDAEAVVATLLPVISKRSGSDQRSGPPLATRRTTCRAPIGSSFGPTREGAQPGMPGRTPGLVGRADECRQIDGLVERARHGHSGVLVVRGDPGIGKTALLEYTIALATGFQVVRATGIESEMELAFAGLHQLCGPMLDRLAVLPEPQREAMRTAFGLTKGTAPDRFMIGLALLSLLSEVAEQAPLLCVVDDAQWLDDASAHALAFAARRLLAEPICMLFGTREPMVDLRGLTEVMIGSLSHHDASALLATVVRGPIDDRVRDRIIAETHGNPLALVEWPRGLTPAELAGGFGLPSLPMAGQIEESFRRRLEELAPGAQRFLTLAAAERTGDPALVWRAAGRIGVGNEEASVAVESGLIESGARMSFRHPLVRSAAYAAASLEDRRAAHRALAEETDATADPDLRAWHLALAAAGPEEEVAAELERCAGRAQARGGLAAAAAMLERSAALTLDPAARARRTIAAAGTHLDAGSLEEAAALLAAAEAGPLDAASRAKLELLRGRAATGFGTDQCEAARLLLTAAKHLEPLDARGARDTYMLALTTANRASDLAGGSVFEEAARAAQAALGPPGPEHPHDLLLDSLALVALQGPAAAVPALRRALNAFDESGGPIEESAWFGYQIAAACIVWDYGRFRRLGELYVEAARGVGALRTLPVALDSLAIAHMLAGDLGAAASLIGEAQAVIEATGNSFGTRAAAQLAALRGHEAEAPASIGEAIEYGRARGQGSSVKIAQSAAATLYNGLGRYDDALLAAQAANRRPPTWSSHLALHELVEAAVRTGQHAVAGEALEELSESASAGGTDWARGIDARSRALVSEGETAEHLYRAAVECLGRTPLRPELARAHLLYGEWLRREKRRTDAREQLRTAHEMLAGMGIEAFAQRAARELAATGETVRKRIVDTLRDLTPQEAQIARLAAEGRTNPEIGSQLFLSARTVEWHLRKVFTKLDVSSRKQLQDALSGGGAVRSPT